MYKLVYTNKFKKSYKKFTKSFPYLNSNIDSVILILQNNPFSNNVSSHKLSGNLYELYSCKCGYDCRIIYSVEKDLINEIDLIILLDIGTHDSVY